MLSALCQILDLALAGGEFAFAGDHGDAEAFAVGVLELLAELGGLGVDLDGEAGGAELRG